MDASSAEGGDMSRGKRNQKRPQQQAGKSKGKKKSERKEKWHEKEKQDNPEFERKRTRAKTAKGYRDKNKSKLKSLEDENKRLKAMLNACSCNTRGDPKNGQPFSKVAENLGAAQQTTEQGYNQGSQSTNPAIYQGHPLVIPVTKPGTIQIQVHASIQPSDVQSSVTYQNVETVTAPVMNPVEANNVQLQVITLQPDNMTVYEASDQLFPAVAQHAQQESAVGNLVYSFPNQSGNLQIPTLVAAQTHSQTLPAAGAQDAGQEMCDVPNVAQPINSYTYDQASHQSSTSVTMCAEQGAVADNLIVNEYSM